jgi:hypothetical protein
MGDRVGSPLGSLGIQGQALPGAARFRKEIRRMIDLYAAAGRGTEVHIGRPCEVALFADQQIDVIVDNGTRTYPQVTALRLSGEIGSLWLRANYNNQAGRVVLYVGEPALGVNFERENPALMGPAASAGVPAWGIGVTDLDFLTVSITTGSDRTDAVYLKGFRLLRLTAGTIDRVEYVDSESGASMVLYVDDNDPAGAAFVKNYAAMPIRLPSAGSFHAIGSSEAVAGSLNYQVQLVYV